MNDKIEIIITDKVIKVIFKYKFLLKKKNYISIKF